ncbi:ComEC/Rec2 family competence protein, partial [Candidatus Parcubacteria bacterium]|nr:ComEC/Rec2 family competence protein [Candidatus Parcubacteria bacterium]
MSPSKILYFCSLSFLGGIFFASLFSISFFKLYFIFLFILAPFVFFKREKFLILILVFIFFFFGFFKYKKAISRPTTHSSSITELEIIKTAKEKTKEKIQKVFGEKFSPWILAFLLGERSQIPKFQKEALRKTGTFHLIAISGLHFTLFSFLFLNLFLALGMKRNFALLLVLFISLFYLLLIGLPISAIRAFFMISLFYLAQIFGRKADSERSLIFVGAILNFFDPLLLCHSLSFQLSFLATFGLVSLYPYLNFFFKKVPNFLKIKENLLATLSAQIFILPILIHYFGVFSLSFLWTNFILVSLFPFLIFSSFLVIFISFFSFSLAKFFSPSVTLILEIFEKTINFFSNFPTFSFPLPFLPFISYFILFSLLIFLKKRFDQPF